MTDRFERELTRRLIEKDAPDPKYVLFLDMLGFSALVEAHPHVIEWDFDAPEGIHCNASESAGRIRRFQYILNDTPNDAQASPSHLMLFSDCAFLVYNRAPEAARSASSLMRQFIAAAVPVRMGLACGTWHVERFSFDLHGATTVTRAAFWGTGVVRAHSAEKYGGKGCRIFLHPSSIDADAGFREAGAVLPVPAADQRAPHELNYLPPKEAVLRNGDTLDWTLYQMVRQMRAGLSFEAPSEVRLQYEETLSALNRMRIQLSRPPFSEPLTAGSER